MKIIKITIVAEEIYVQKYKKVYAQLRFYLREEIGVKLEKESWCELIQNY